MSSFVYIIANQDCTSVHCGHCKDIHKMLTFYSKMPNLSYPPKKLNMLIYVEEYPEQEKRAIIGMHRFEEFSSSSREQLLSIAKTVNPDLIELIPGVNFELS